MMEKNGHSGNAAVNPGKKDGPKLTAEDKLYIKRDMEYSLEQIQDHIDAYISCSMVLNKTGEAAAKKELRLLIDDYLKKIKIDEWLSDQSKG